MVLRATVLLLMVGACAPGASAPPAAAPDSGAGPAKVDGWLSPLDADHPLVGAILHGATLEPLDEEVLRRRVLDAELILLGEAHDNPDHHRLQAKVLEWLSAAGKTPSVVFEMLDFGDQARVDAALEASRDPDAFARAVDWASSGWPDWSLYRPVFAAALGSGGPIIAANIPRGEAMELAQGARALDPELSERFGLDRPLGPELAHRMREELHASHCGHFPQAMLEPMILIQRARDARMAERMLSAPQRPVVLVAGGGHARADRGVPMYLHAQGERSILSIGFVQVSPEAHGPRDYVSRYHASELPFDVVWFTPRANDRDRCAELKEHMRRRAAQPDDGE